MDKRIKLTKQDLQNKILTLKQLINTYNERNEALYQKISRNDRLILDHELEILKIEIRLAHRSFFILEIVYEKVPSVYCGLIAKIRKKKEELDWEQYEIEDIIKKYKSFDYVIIELSRINEFNVIDSTRYVKCKVQDLKTTIEGFIW